MTINATTSTSLEDRQRAAAEEADRLAAELAKREAGRRAAEITALISAANKFVSTELPKIGTALDAAEARLLAASDDPEATLDTIWTAYLEIRTLSRTRHREHTVAVSVLDQHDPLPASAIGVDRKRPIVADTWTETPWHVLVDRIIERRLAAADSNAYAARLRWFDQTSERATAKFKD